MRLFLAFSLLFIMFGCSEAPSSQTKNRPYQGVNPAPNSPTPNYNGGDSNPEQFFPEESPQDPSSPDVQDPTAQDPAAGDSGQEGLEKNDPPIVGDIEPQTVKFGESLILAVMAEDPNPTDLLSMIFSTKEEVLGPMPFENGLLTLPIPEDIESQNLTGIVLVQDSTGNVVEKTFPIAVIGKKPPSQTTIMVKEGVAKLCENLTGMQQTLCELGKTGVVDPME